MAAASDQPALDAIAANFRRGDLAAARADCERFLAAVNDARRRAPVYFWLGAIDARGGSHAAAAGHFEQALAVNRRDPFWLLQAGLSFFHIGDSTRAEKLYRDALRLEPRNALAHYNLGVLLQMNADVMGARRAFEAALSHQPQFAEAHTNLANTLVALGETGAAEAHYRQAIAINPQLALAHHGLGLHHLRQQQLDAARRCFEAAVAHDPGHIDAWLDLAECQHLGGQDEQAVASVDRALAVDPQHAAAQFKRAQFTGRQPARAPGVVIERLYAGMAGNFDEHLVQRLGYRIPSLLIEALKPWLTEFAKQKGRLPAVLDLGCGTGLFGVVVREFAASLTGVDLSTAMLAKARERGLYDSLIESDLLSFLPQRAAQDRARFDLITATDVLIYLGKVDELFTLVASRLSPGGVFAFSTESPPQLADDWRLEASGRYVHSPAYITRLAMAAGLEIVARMDTIVRSENGRPLDGHVYLLRMTG